MSVNYKVLPTFSKVREILENVLVYLSAVWLYLIKKPAVFPLCAYAFLIPFDNLLSLGSAGTITRYLGILSITVIWLNRIIVKRLKIRKPPKVVWSWALFTFLAFISQLWALDTMATTQGLFTLGGLFLIYFSCGILQITDKDYSLLATCTLLGGVTAAIFSIILFARGITYQQTIRASLVIGSERWEDPNEFATSLILPLALALGLFVYGRKLWRVLGGVCVIMMGVAIFLSGSRGGAIGAFIATAMLMKRLKWRTRLKLIVAVALAISIVSCFNPHLVIRFSLQDVLVSGGAGRFAIWQVGWNAFVKKPLFGYGYNNFSHAYEIARVDFPQTGYFVRPFQVAHNIYLQVLVELGLLGGVIILAAIWQHWKTLRNFSGHAKLAKPLEAALLGVCISGVNLGILAAKPFWWLLTLLVILLNVLREPKRTQT